MRAIILAAGVGARLGSGEDHPPKAMLKFGGKTLFQRHLEILEACGIEEVVTVTGYRGQLFEAEINRLGAQGFVRQLDNPHFREGSVVSLWTAREELEKGEDILVMDADVLYTQTLIKRLLESPHPNCLLVDRELDPGDEPVKVCIENETIVNFGKLLPRNYETMGEWPGFMKLSPRIASRMVEACAAIIDAGRPEQPCEDAIYDVLMAEPGVFGFEDVTGEPWIEIDFPEDLERAKVVILPKLGKAVA